MFAQLTSFLIPELRNYVARTGYFLSIEGKNVIKCVIMLQKSANRKLATTWAWVLQAGESNYNYFEPFCVNYTLQMVFLPLTNSSHPLVICYFYHANLQLTHALIFIVLGLSIGRSTSCLFEWTVQGPIIVTITKKKPHGRKPLEGRKFFSILYFA